MKPRVVGGISLNLQVSREAVKFQIIRLKAVWLMICLAKFGFGKIALRNNALSLLKKNFRIVTQGRMWRGFQPVRPYWIAEERKAEQNQPRRMRKSVVMSHKPFNQTIDFDANNICKSFPE